MRQLFERFVKERKYLKNVTPKTVDWYWNSWAALCGKSVWATSSDMPPKEYWTARIAELREQGVSASSVNTYSRAINAFLKWAVDEGLIQSPVRIPRLKEEKRILATLTATQVDRLLRWKPKNPSAIRIHTIACLMLDTGLRANEALSIYREDVDLENLLLKIKGKGQKERMIPISLEMRRIFCRWLSKHEFDLVFPTANGTK